MAGETPDYQRLNVQSTVFPMTDLGELAARLGSPVIFDRRGDIVFIEDFRHGLDLWLTGGAGAGATVDLSPTGSRSGPFSCRLVNGSDGSAFAVIEHVVPLPALSAVGLEASFVAPSFGSTFALRMDYADGTRLHRFELEYRESDEDLRVLQGDGSFETVASGIDVFQGLHGLSTMKLVVDLATAGYVRGIFNSITVDLSSFAADDIGAITIVQIAPQVVHRNASGFNRSVYVDDVILTQNEPP